MWRLWSRHTGGTPSWDTPSILCTPLFYLCPMEMSASTVSVCLSLALFPRRPKRMHFLTGPGCKVLIAGLRGTSFLPCILIQLGLRHRGLILKRRTPAKNRLPTRVQGQDVFSLSDFLRSACSLQIVWAITTVWSILWTKPTGWRLCMKGSCHFADTIRQIFTRFCQQIDSFALSKSEFRVVFFVQGGR